MVGRVQSMPVRRVLLFAVVALALVGCVDRKSDRSETGTPAPVEAAHEEQPVERAEPSDTVIGTIVPSATATEVTSADFPSVNLPESTPGRQATPPPPINPAPPTTVDEYNPELVDWCADVDRRMGDVQSLTDFTVESALLTLEHFRAIRATALPELHAPLDDLISALELLTQGLENGEITDPKGSLVRWALTTLGPERIASLRASFDTVFGFVTRSCLDA